jgi:hypothetical protein
MTQEEKIRLVVAMTTISDPCRNWAYGWKILCELADIDPAKMPAHFLTPELAALPGATPQLHEGVA